MKRLLIAGFGDIARRALPRPPRLPRAQMADRVARDLYSFMSESRRLDNSRMKQRLGVALRYPSVYGGLGHGRAVGID